MDTKSSNTKTIRRASSLNSDEFEIYLDDVLKSLESDQVNAAEISSPDAADKENNSEKNGKIPGKQTTRPRSEGKEIDKTKRHIYESPTPSLKPEVGVNTNTTGTEDSTLATPTNSGADSIESEENQNEPNNKSVDQHKTEDTVDKRTSPGQNDFRDSIRRGSDPPNSPELDFVSVTIPEGEDITIDQHGEGENEEGLKVGRLEYASEPSYLEAHMAKMQFLGLKPSTDETVPYREGIQWAFVLISSFCSVVLRIQYFKGYLLDVVAAGNLYDYMTLFYSIITTVLQILYLWIIFTNRITAMQISFEKMFKTFGVKNMERGTNSNKAFNIRLHWVSLLSIASACAMGTGLNTFCKSFDPTDVVQSKSYRMYAFLFAWSKTNYENDTDALWEKAGRVEKSEIGVMCIQIMLEVMGMLNIQMIKDILPLAAMDIDRKTNIFKTYLDSITNLDLDILKIIYNNYEFLHRISIEIEKCYGPLFLANHVHNLLFGAYFLADCIKLKVDLVSFIVRMIIMIKIVLGYWKSVQAFKTGEKVEQVLHNLSTNEAAPGQVGIVRQEISVMVGRIKARPVGIGSGMFLVTQDFLYRFFQCVVSGFLWFLRAQAERGT